MVMVVLTTVLGLKGADDDNFIPHEIPIRPGDLISISMLEDIDVVFNGVVDASGFISLVYLGEVKIIGLRESDCASYLQRLLEKDFYQKATVTVRVIKRAPGVIYIYGAVKEPGAVPLPELGQLTILQAISSVKGITSWASPEICQITRQNPISGEREKFTVNLIAAFREIGGVDDIPLIASDVVFVPSANAELSQVLSNEPYEVIVVGQVNDPGIVSFAPGELRSFMRALFKAGNFTNFAKKKAVRVIRYSKDNKNREVMVVDAEKMIDQGYLELDFELIPGDMIIVDEKLINF
jgi:protein involved in polysaccharide export with SLBB domain